MDAQCVPKLDYYHLVYYWDYRHAHYFMETAFLKCMCLDRYFFFFSPFHNSTLCFISQVLVGHNPWKLVQLLFISQFASFLCCNIGVGRGEGGRTLNNLRGGGVT